MKALSIDMALRTSTYCGVKKAPVLEHQGHGISISFFYFQYKSIFLFKLVCQGTLEQLNAQALVTFWPFAT